MTEHHSQVLGHKDTEAKLSGDQNCPIGDKQDDLRDSKEPNGTSDILIDQPKTSIGKNSGTTDKDLHPFVHWSQSQTHISLRIDLTQVEGLNVFISEDGLTLQFSARGKGAHGSQDYFFELELYSPVDGRKYDCHTIERYVLILLKKADSYARKKWPRLTREPTKLAWLRVDFDRYADSDDSNADSESFNINDGLDYSDHQLRHERQSFEQLKNQINATKSKQATTKFNDETRGKDSPKSSSYNLDNIFKTKESTNFDIFNPFNRRISKKDSKSTMKHDYRREAVSTDNSKNTARHGLNGQKTYLFLYNLLMFIMFLKVTIVLLIKGLSGDVDDDTVQGAALIIKYLTYTQLLETIHPILGLVPGGPLMPFTQVVGRLLVNHFLAEPTIRIDSAPYPQYLFLVWSTIEIFRYSFYALRVFKVNIHALTWCRYTLFMPLYPMGGLCESMIIMATVKYYEKTGQYSLALPNSINMSFNLPIFLKVYTFMILGPTIMYLMRYMWSQRCRQLKEKTA